MREATSRQRQAELAVLDQAHHDLLGRRPLMVVPWELAEPASRGCDLGGGATRPDDLAVLVQNFEIHFSVSRKNEKELDTSFFSSVINTKSH
jgi:hypothetical protein